MKTFAVHTLGCKVNQYESQQIRQILEEFGLAIANRPQQPDIVVVNTCCVTHIASAKSRQNIRKVQKTNPKAAIIVTGCLPSGQSNELQNLQNIIIAKDKKCLPTVLGKVIDQINPVSKNITLNKPLNRDKIKDKIGKFPHQHHSESNLNTLLPDKLDILTRFTEQCRAFLKVQDGCDAYCTYCIIPKIRTNVCNKDVKSVLTEARNLVVSGHKEIILTGIFLGAYGQTTARRKKWDTRRLDSLAELVNEVAAIDGLARLRLSSLEPLDVTDRLLDVMTDHDNIMPHLHLPLQSGSTNILRKMARQYTIDDYLQVVKKVERTFDRPAITTDIIVGFPGETEEDFNLTLEVAKQVGFSKIHVFSFSGRKDTAAEKMAALFGKVPSAEIKRRSSVLQQLDEQLQQQFRQSCRGLQETVIIEKTNPPRGRCTRYFMVDLDNQLDSNKLSKGQLVNVPI